MFFAALTSRSWAVLQPEHVHVRTLSVPLRSMLRT
ncbi:hypothetical protein N599_36190 [Saccharopolyspora erythraea D]|nr:hypothetical protein N599_36190 [Saccharopolyspora erythraea D]